MLYISFSEGFVFFGAIVLGAIIGIVSSFLVESSYQIFERVLKEIRVVVFICSLVVFVALVGVSLYYFVVLSNVDDASTISLNSTCPSQNITYVVNNYNYTITQIIVKNPNLIPPLEELKGFIQKKPVPSSGYQN
ncbi:hypothetical protein [Methanoregula sp.]|uniref:hypothetical protein n=1 Tax=Methanoregula sp. TaxID=2052170 RepID=UPI003564DA83